MTLAACIEHQPIHTFGKGYSCALCGCRLPALGLTEDQKAWFERKAAEEGDLEIGAGRAPPPPSPAGEGWQTVPKEPTEEMLKAAIDGVPGAVLDDKHGHRWRSSRTTEEYGIAYRAMLAAAPTPPSSENWLTPEEEAEIVEDINSGRWPYLQPAPGSEPSSALAVLDADLLEDFREDTEGEGLATFPKANIRKLIAEIDRLRGSSALAEAMEVIRSLANTADGLSFREDAIRQIVGNTNWNVLRVHIDAARAFLVSHSKGE